MPVAASTTARATVDTGRRPKTTETTAGCGGYDAEGLGGGKGQGNSLAQQAPPAGVTHPAAAPDLSHPPLGHAFPGPLRPQYLAATRGAVGSTVRGRALAPTMLFIRGGGGGSLE